MVIRPVKIHANLTNAWLVILLLACPMITLAVRRPMRSVKECDRQEPIVIAFAPGFCRDYCEKTYVNVNKERRLANRNLFQADLVYKSSDDIPELAELVPAEQIPFCCCLFEAPWPSFVNASSIARDADLALMERKAKHEMLTCLPLMGQVALKGRTRKSYETLCKYLDRRKPMTILELMQFAEAAEYLNYMQPRHPSILLTLRKEPVKRIQWDEFKELKDALYEFLLDDSYKWKGWPDYYGFHLDTGRFDKILKTRDKLKLALRSTFVDQALDELAISQVLVDVAAASARVDYMNKYEFNIPQNLLDGNYDKYFRDLDNYFKLQSVNCVTLEEFTQQVSIYLSRMKSLLSKLHEKLVYDYMTQSNQHLKQILESLEIYKHLLKVNCEKK